ncbi:hypothetical protein [Methylotenera sp.]|uniref:hypothetical protein n=1 Tax=Methylotenera sp. TaxID=2051956 RepID=UPI00248A2584|nr:hypothetical protein [Methylotenera sp.]MDI1362549.1 hypothetical protein [Methylotenera sp.]
MHSITELAARFGADVRELQKFGGETEITFTYAQLQDYTGQIRVRTQEEIDYPRDIFNSVIQGNSPYAFYLFQWVNYQTDAKLWRLKMHHDVKTFDGREAFNIWPNGSSCGPFKDSEVEFIRISKNAFGREYVDPRFKES